MSSMQIAPPPLQIPVKTPSEGMRAIVHVVLQHTAEFFDHIVKAVGEKYGISEDELSAVITSHPEYSKLKINPLMGDQTSLSPAATAAVVADLAPPVIRKFKLLKKASTKTGQ
jgi:hypothetical protein